MCYMEERERALEYAKQAASAATAVAMERGVPQERIVHEAVDPCGDGTGTVSSSILRYVSDNKVSSRHPKAWYSSVSSYQ